MKTIKLITILSLFSCYAVLADSTISLSYTDSLWRPFLNGQTDTQLNTNINQTSGQVAYDSDRVLELTISRKKSLVPNVGLQTNIKEHKQRANVNSLVVFDSVAYSAGKSVDSQVDLTHRDHLIYYRLGYSDIDIDVGMNVVRFDGRVVLRGDNMHQIIEHKDTKAGFYGNVQYDIPESNFYFKANATYVLDTNSEFNKSRVMMGYRADSGIQVELGYQAYRAEWSDYMNTDGHLKFEGLYTGMQFNF